MSYLVSILVPVYGVERYIERCARSLFEQDYENLEFVFVDDCTPDHSIDILKKVIIDYPERKNQVRIVRHERNRGLGAARNTAVRNANGLFLIHCDSDDWLDKSAVSWLVNRQISTRADIVSGKSCWVYDNYLKAIEEPLCKNKEDLLLQMLSVNRVSSYAIWKRLIRTSLYSEHHIEVQEGLNICEDLQVTPKLVYYANKVTWIDKVIYYYYYYYYQSNPSSYTKQLRNNTLLRKQKFSSYENLRTFFKDKEKELFKAASEKAIYEYMECGRYAAIYRNKVLFNNYKEAVYGTLAQYQYVLGSPTPLKKWIQEQYLIYGVFLRTRSFIYEWMKSLIGVR